MDTATHHVRCDNNRRMPLPSTLDPASELDRVAAALDWSLRRDDWWGPARLAFDSEVQHLRDVASTLADELRTLP